VKNVERQATVIMLINGFTVNAPTSKQQMLLQNSKEHKGQYSALVLVVFSGSVTRCLPIRYGGIETMLASMPYRRFSF
jgi:hypothetical protein